MTCYHISDEKTAQILGLHFVPSRHFSPGLQSAHCTDGSGIAIFVRASLTSGPKYWGPKRNFSETILAAMIDVWIVC